MEILFGYDVSEDRLLKSNRISHESTRGCTLLQTISLVISLETYQYIEGSVFE